MNFLLTSSEVELSSLNGGGQILILVNPRHISILGAAPDWVSRWPLKSDQRENLAEAQLEWPYITTCWTSGWQQHYKNHHLLLPNVGHPFDSRWTDRPIFHTHRQPFILQCDNTFCVISFVRSWSRNADWAEIRPSDKKKWWRRWAITDTEVELHIRYCTVEGWPQEPQKWFNTITEELVGSQ